MRTVNVQITWPDATCIAGVVRYEGPDFGSVIHWTGDPERIAKLPAELVPDPDGEGCSLICLLTHGEYFAETQGATFQWSDSGHYDMWA